MRSEVRAVAAVAILSACASCLRQPVRETVTVEVDPEGGVKVEAEVLLLRSDSDELPPPAKERVRDLQQALMRGTDDWTRRFERIEPAWERVVVEKDRGEPVRVERSAILSSRDDLSRFFSDTGVGVSLNDEPKALQIELQPGAPLRATRAQKELMRRTLGEWSEAAATYFSAVSDLYRYLDDRPERAPACFYDLFDLGHLGANGGEKPSPPVDETESELTRRVAEGMESLAGILQVSKDEAYSLDEVSRLVFDPFPAEFAVRFTGEVLESENLVARGRSEYAVPVFGLWEAMGRHVRHWADPDPAQIYYGYLRREEDRPFPVQVFNAGPRRADRPSPEEIREALEAELTPAAVYRLRWRLPEPEERRGGE